MALSFDPFREMDRVTSQLFGPTGERTRGPRWMPMDLYRSGDHYVVNVDLPGVDPGSIDLNVDGNTLTVRAERSVKGDDGAQWIAQERPAGSFMRQLSLGEGLDVSKIHASYEQGVLSLTIPVAEQAKPRRIEVHTNGDKQREISPSGQTVSGQVSSSESAD